MITSVDTGTFSFKTKCGKITTDLLTKEPNGGGKRNDTNANVKVGFICTQLLNDLSQIPIPYYMALLYMVYAITHLNSMFFQCNNFKKF